MRSALEEGLDIGRLARLLHVHSYSLSRALTEFLGEMQAIATRYYAEHFIEHAKLMGIEIHSMGDVRAELIQMGLMKDIILKPLAREREGEVLLVVQGCRLAPLIHRPLGMLGYTGDICPLSPDVYGCISGGKGMEAW